VDVDVDGLTYREVTNPTQAWTANARNVIPGSFTVNVNHRFAPDKSLEEAEAQLRALVTQVGPAEGAEVVVTDRAPACPPSRTAPIVEAFIAAADATVAAQQSWTDVARFAELGVPALNYGPGITSQSHQRGELVPVANLVPAREAVGRFLADPSS
jgi:succinyl-diaminopimelate desuccinylase